MSAVMVVVVAGAVSYVLRASMVMLASRTGVPTVFTRAARYTVPVAFAALATSALTAPTAGVAAVAPLVAVVVAVLAVRLTGSALAALPVGLPLLWLLLSLGW